MVILSVGMPRAGSGWFFNLTNDLIISSGFQDVRHIRTRYHLQNILTEVNCNIGALSWKRLLPVMIPAFLGNTYVVKAHSSLTSITRRFIQFGMIRPTYIYRDPRDALLSAMEVGQRARQDGRQNKFAELYDFDTGVEFILNYVHIWEAWCECEKGLHIRYEDLLLKYEDEVDRLLSFLNLEHKNETSDQIISKYDPKENTQDLKGIHFSQGRIGRFRQEFTKQQQVKLAQTFGSYLEKMGYEI